MPLISQVFRALWDILPPDNIIGGMLKAIQMIREAKEEKGLSDTGVVVDLHPSRPDYRGLGIGDNIISLQADPTFEEIGNAGATIDKHSEAHTVLDDMFLISGEIPRVTPYEHGLKNAMRFDKDDGEWFSDEMIADERFLMCNLKGMYDRAPMAVAF